MTLHTKKGSHSEGLLSGLPQYSAGAGQCLYPASLARLGGCMYPVSSPCLGVPVPCFLTLPGVFLYPTSSGEVPVPHFLTMSGGSCTPLPHLDWSMCVYPASSLCLGGACTLLSHPDWECVYPAFLPWLCLYTRQPDFNLFLPEVPHWN